MIKLRVFKTPIYVSYYFCALITLLLLLDRTGVFFISLTAVTIHETSHLLCMKICKSNVIKIELNLSSLRIFTSGTDTRKSMLIALSGPLGNFVFCLMFLFVGLKDYAFVNLIIGVFNLLPVAGLDGGDILGIIVKKHSSKCVLILLTVLSVSVCVLIIASGFFLFLSKNHNPTLIFVGIYLLFKIYYKV